MAKDNAPVESGEAVRDEPPIPPVGERRHHATWARDKKNPGKYLVRIEGPYAAAFAGRSVPVTRMDRGESVERLTRPVWAGHDEDGTPVALYQYVERERDAQEELPF